MAIGGRRIAKLAERSERPATQRARPTRQAAASPADGVRSLQRKLGNRAVGAMVQGGPAPGRTVVQRTPDDVYRLVYSFQGRLKKGPGIDAAALQILNEITQFASRFTDQETRQELANRAGMILAD